MICYNRGSKFRNATLSVPTSACFPYLIPWMRVDICIHWGEGRAEQRVPGLHLATPLLTHAHTHIHTHTVLRARALGLTLALGVLSHACSLWVRRKRGKKVCVSHVIRMGLFSSILFVLQSRMRNGPISSSGEVSVEMVWVTFSVNVNGNTVVGFLVVLCLKQSPYQAYNVM